MQGCIAVVFWVATSSEFVERPFVAGKRNIAVQHPFGGEQFVPQMRDLRPRAAQHRHFQAMPFPKMDVQARHDQVVMVMLLVDKLCRQFAGVMIVDHGYDGDLLFPLIAGLLANEQIANEIANRLAARRVALGRDDLVEGLEQVFFKRDADSREVCHGWFP